MQVFHVATATDWEEALRTGAYTTSTRGRTLEQEGFIHAARREQVPGVYQRYYADATEPMVLLTIDTDLLDVPWREDPVGEDTYPHLYGPLRPRAVVAAQPFGANGSSTSFTSMFVSEMLWRVGLAVVAMVLAAVGSVLLGLTGWELGPLVGAIAGLSIGVVVFVLVLRRRR